MSELPSSWVTAPLSELCNRIVDGSHNPPSATERGKPMLSARNIQQRRILFDNYRLIPEAAFEHEHQRTQATPHDILLTIVGTIGRVAIVQEDTPEFTLQRSVAVLKPNTNLTPRFLAYALESPRIQKHLTDNAKGTAQKGIYLKALGTLEMEVAPLSEQKRIADKLDAVLERVDNCRDRLDRIPAILKRFRQSVLAAATSGKLTEDWRAERLTQTQPQMESGNIARDSSQLRYAIAATSDSVMRPSYEAGWHQTTVGDLITGIEAGLNVRCEERPPEASELGLVKISAVTWGVFNDDESKTLPKGKQLPDSARIRVGDFLISRANTLELVGACVIVHEVTRPVFLSDKVLRLVMSDADKRWLLYVLRSDYGRDQIESLSSGNQLSMRNLSQANLKRIVVPLPSEEERCEIVRRVESFFAYADRLEARYSAARAQVEKLTPSTLAKAFRGELVPQDPNDEPACELLARIAKNNIGKPEKKSAINRRQ